MVRRSAVVILVVVAVASGAAVLTHRTGGTFVPTEASSSAVGRPLAASPNSGAGSSGPASGAASAPIACPDPAPPGQGSSPLGSASHVFTRSTDDGVAIRVYKLTEPTVVGCGPVFPEGSTGAPAVACGSSSVSVEMSDESAVGQGFLTASMDAVAANGSSTASGDAAHAESQPEALSSGAFGVVEGDPVWWVAVQVGSEVAQVEITFADGSSDEMTPVGGIALLAHHIVATTLSTDPYSVKGSLTFTDASGNVLDTVTLPDVPTPMTVPLPVPASPSSTPP
ncbi:MAG TPA: hypothetical protein VLX59_00735, partial [Acidimicrobiales bacterium]|nr:hypothetical protein [Acidimicrobiales bacterium]